MEAEPQDYEVQQQKNAEQATAMFKVLFPSFPVFNVPLAEIIKIMMYLEETNVNANLLPHVIRGIHNITLGTGDGDVLIHINKNTSVMIETRERNDTDIRAKVKRDR